jgi:uncharacterized protein
MPSSVQHQASLPPVIEAMLRPGFYPHPVGSIELRRTHTSYVLLAGEFAYKVRKSVRFPFIDCSTVARRFALCQLELELNRRLSPDVYLGVVAIRQNGDQIILDQSGDKMSTAIEFAVKMRRLTEDRRLDVMARRNEVTKDDIREIADTIGRFHVSTPNSHSWAYGAAANIWRMTIGNLIEIEQLGPDESLRGKIADVESYSRRYIATHWELLNSRAREGRVHEGHGDLRADAVYLTAGGIRIIDCLEFDERLRYADIANEVAFLAMDIERLGRADLSSELVAQFVGDAPVAVLTPFYKSYRASVRAKVELLRSRQEDCSAEDSNTARSNALNLLDLALGYRVAPKALLVVCGASGTGKSSLATVLSEHLGYDIISSDVVRKQLAGIEPNTSAAALYNQGIYTPEFTDRVYDALRAEAQRVLESGNGVILDATFSKRGYRELIIDTARETGIEPLFIECRADKDIVIQRLSQREHDPERVSDANIEIYVTQRSEFEPLDELPLPWHKVIDTTEDLSVTALEIERAVRSREYRNILSSETRPE